MITTGLWQLLAAGTVAAGPLPVPAFPGAEGFGANTPGGRGGKVLLITTVEDYNPGSKAPPIYCSLRATVETEGPRIIVFRVSGVIDLKAPLEITKPFITIAGQTEPGRTRMANDEAQVRILQASGPIFAAKGYHGATIREICEAAGVNVAAVNYHFRNKRTLYAASLGFALESTASRAPFPAWTPEEPAEVRLKECVCTLVERMTKSNDVAWQTRLILRECLAPTGIRSEETARFIQLPMDVLLPILEDLLPGDSLQAKRLWLGYSIMSQCMFARIAFAMLPRQHGDPPSSDEVAQHITDLSLAAISRFNQE